MDKIMTPYFSISQTKGRKLKPKYDTILKLRQFARSYKCINVLKELGDVTLN